MAAITFILYCILGPFAWLAMIAGFVLGRSRMNRLSKPPPLAEPAPSATIVIPAKDEVAGIRKCVESVLRQDYPQVRILAIDDRSTDGTGELLDELAADSGDKLQVSHIPRDALPAGWLGKCHALHEGTRTIDSAWLCFVDSDVTLQPRALRDTIALAESRSYDAISLFPALDGRSFWEWLMIPPCAACWAVTFTVSLTNNDNIRSVAAANGQFLLIRRSAYEAVGGHSTVRSQIVEDVELMRLLKSQGYRCRLFNGSHLLKIRMHSTLAELRSGWGRIFAGTARFRKRPLILAMLWIVLCGFSVYPALIWGWRSQDKGWMIASLLHFGLITGYLSMVYRATGARLAYALLFPLSGAILLKLLAIGVRRCAHRHFEWRGTRISAEVGSPIPPGKIG